MVCGSLQESIYKRALKVFQERMYQRSAIPVKGNFRTQCCNKSTTVIYDSTKDSCWWFSASMVHPAISQFQPEYCEWIWEKMSFISALIHGEARRLQMDKHKSPRSHNRWRKKRKNRIFLKKQVKWKNKSGESEKLQWILFHKIKNMKE